jgi:divalent metal cation (Fe/Co/Zn/Cd) transporter
VVTLRIVGWSFVALAAYVTVDGVRSLYLAEEPDRSWFGLVILVLSVIVMPVHAWAKRRVAIKMQSGALEAEAKQTSLCAYLSAIALAGVGLNALFSLVVGRADCGSCNGANHCARRSTRNSTATA